MRRRFSTAATLAALLAVYLGVPCLALARAHDSMARETSSAPCETSDAPAAKLLCAAPSTYAPLAAGLPDVPTGALAPISHPPALVIAPGPAPAPRDPDFHGVDPPAFLLHSALLI
jgi:hypothetical protein